VKEKILFGFLLFAVLILSGSVYELFYREKHTEPVQRIELPDHTAVMEYDIADYCGEQGCIYVVRAEWVYLSRESAEEKMKEMRQ
jgi:hypothetical protein